MGLFDKLKSAILGKEEAKEEAVQEERQAESEEEALPKEEVEAEQEETPPAASGQTTGADQAPSSPLDDAGGISRKDLGEAPEDSTQPPSSHPSEAGDKEKVETSSPLETDHQAPSSPEIGEETFSRPPAEEVQEPAIPKTKEIDQDSPDPAQDLSAETEEKEKGGFFAGGKLFGLGKSEETKEEQVEETKTFEKGLTKSRRSFTRRLNELFANFRYEDEEFFEELEDLLIESDVGFEATMQISDVMRYEAKVENIRTMADAERVLVQTLVDMYGESNPDYVEFNDQENELTVLLFVGVNGVGKTTTIAKLAHQYQEKGQKVLLAAGDTFRAGAIEQLHVWGERVGADVVSTKQGGDPSAVVFEAINQAKAQGVDVLMIDTAGRLQNKKNLMNELDKMRRVISREIPDAPHETLLVLDATTGQNALTQAKIFKETTNVTGIVLTKMDGTAKGGIVLAIGKELGIPVKFVGLGETMDDLREFDTERFAYGLFRDLIEQTN